MEPVISQLVTVLLIGCQDANSQARLLCGECLGELGAIDPGRLDFSTSETQGKHFTFVVRSVAVFCIVLRFYLGVGNLLSLDLENLYLLSHLKQLSQASE